MNHLLDARETAARLPFEGLVKQIRELLLDPSITIPERIVMPLSGGGSLFVMPGTDGRIAITKLITFTPGNAGGPRPSIQGDVTVFDVATGERVLILDGPTVTARRTAAVSLLAAQELAPNPAGPLLIVGAGAQGLAHLEAFAKGLPLKEVVIASRSAASAQALAAHARKLGLRVQVTADPSAALAGCPMVVTCTPASAVVIAGVPRSDAFIAAVGAFTPAMVEAGPQLCRHVAAEGLIVVDTPEAVHEAGDLLQAGLDVALFPTLKDVVAGRVTAGKGPVLFKSCGWAGWDLAAARAAVG